MSIDPSKITYTNHDIQFEWADEAEIAVTKVAANGPGAGNRVSVTAPKISDNGETATYRVEALCGNGTLSYTATYLYERNRLDIAPSDIPASLEAFLRKRFFEEMAFAGRVAPIKLDGVTSL